MLGAHGRCPASKRQDHNGERARDHAAGVRRRPDGRVPHPLVRPAADLRDDGQNEGASTVFSLCTFLPRVHYGALQGRGSGGEYFLACYFAQPISAVQTSGLISGCVISQGIVSSGGAQFHGNTCVSGASTVNPGASVGILGTGNGNAWSDAAWSIGTGGAVLVNGIFHGSYSITHNGANTSYHNATGSTYVLQAALTTGALKIGSQTTGSSYSAGTWTDGISLTPANIDSHNGALQNPQTGSRFTTSV